MARPTPIDPRGPRFAAALTSLVLAVTLVLGVPRGLVPLGLQALVFAAGVALGPGRSPYAAVFRRLVRPRLAPPRELEDPRPPRFAQAVGLGFAVVGLVGGALGASVVFFVAVAFALVAALLNAVVDLCLGCEVWVLLQRLRRRDVGPRRTAVAGG
ncbi:DUF4395 domain-containing protein [Serinibacter arcticus]|uniref:DUF4395 domain-containing protein n=1 Tax=Serinibacter arcticus TaxID=1655435 RepID=A0A2U1ZSI4_9MICO|nr:DUF4395 domain-containing protein [Serinibacter arcticus]PWD49945.1 DUF4395 domain-containing protein [Serinibacter arcticus]